MKQYLTLLLIGTILIPLHPHPTAAHNGAVAIAVPVEGITVDGDLSDWPEGMREYEIGLPEIGVPPKDSLDFQGSFRIGFNEEENALYVAVEVQDESIVVLDSGGSWNNQDGCEVYLGMEHRKGAPVKQHAIYGNQQQMGYGHQKVKRRKGIHQYEWRMDIGKRTVLDSQLLLGIDVVVCDKDRDGSFSWMAWGPKTEKFKIDQVGFAVLDEEKVMGTIKGRIKWEDIEDGTRLGKVRIQSLTSKEFWIDIKTDSQGMYEFQLLPGRYRIEVDYRRRRESIEVEVLPGSNTYIKEIYFPWPRRMGVAVKAGEGRRVKVGKGLRQEQWRTLSVADGLSNSNVSAIFQDSKGHLWFGTVGGGVSRYDGVELTVFAEEDGLAGNGIFAIAEDKQGHLWFGTENGLCRYDGNVFETFTTEDGLEDNRITAIKQDREGYLWIGTVSGMSRYDGDRFIPFTTLNDLAVNHVESIVEDHRGNLWCGTRSGVNRYDRKTWTPFIIGDNQGNLGVNAILEDRKEHLWFGTWGDGVSRYDGKAFVTFTAEDGLAGDRVTAIAEDRDGYIWFGTTEGISRYDGKEFVTFNAEDGIAGNRVESIIEDNEGNLWCGTTGGISRYDGKRSVSYTDKDGLVGNNVISIVEDNEGSIWFGTDSGISRFDGRRPIDFTTIDELIGESVASILVDYIGQIWFATLNGVIRYDGKQFVNFTISQGLPDNRVNCIAEDRKGNLWFGTRAGGVSRYDGKEFTTITMADGLVHNNVNSISEDRKGNLWFGTWGGGVSRYDGERFTHFTSADGMAGNYVHAILENREGVLFFATERGVSRYDGMEFVNYRGTEGLADNYVNSIFEDREGDLWFGTRGGINKYDGFVFQSFYRRDGPVYHAVNDILQDHKGNFWIASEGGITHYIPPKGSPLISLTDVLADRRYGPVADISLSTLQDHIAFEFQGRSTSTHWSEMVYVFQLEGYDEDWQQTRENRVEYTNLPVGRYIFQVKAIDRDLNYSKEPATLAVEVYYQPVSSSIRISDLNIQDVFASFYKTYAEKPIGSVLATNDDPTQIEATLSFYIPDHMRRPTEQTILLEPQSSQIVSLHAIIDDEILSLEGATPAQAEVSLSCELGEQTFSIQESENITVYGRGALTWDDLGRAAAFVTPEDHNISVFSRSLFEEYRSRVQRRDIDGNIPTAMLLFEALNAHGIKYTKDASTPYSQVRGNRSAIDNIQYPSELLISKMGDCDDCTVLYCALLENLDIPTAFIDHPNHILMMFDSGITEDRYFGFSLDEDRYVEREGRFWIPVEVTKLGEGSFMEAWELGAKTCQRLQNVGELVTDVRKVWPEYPYALPSIEEEIKPPDSEELDRAFVDDMEQLQAIRDRYIERTYIRSLLEDPENHRRRMELGYTLMESGDFNNAISTFSHLLDTPLKAEAYNLIGICYAGQKNYEAATRYMEKAVEYDPKREVYKRRLEVLRGELAQ